MNVKSAIRLIKKHRPRTPEDFHKLGLKFRYLGAGVFREAVEIKGIPLVVKFPLYDEGYRHGKIHSTVEIRKIKRLNRYKYLRPYLPKVYYHDRKSGILVMHKYEKFSRRYDQCNALGDMITDLIFQLTGITVCDIYGDNVKMGRTRNSAVLVDLGY